MHKHVVEIDHVRQFYVCRSEIPFRADWKSLPITEDLWLHAHPDLALVQFSFRGSRCIVAGDVATCSPEFSRVYEFDDTDTIEDVYRFWAGRWVLFVDGVVHGDASGLYTIFYTKRDDERLLLTSSLALAKEVTTGSIGEIPPFGGNPDTFFNWVPPPVTILPDYIRQLPDQLIELSQPPKVIGRRSDRLYRYEGRDAIGDYARSLVALYARFPHNHFLVPLTSGFDSRTVLSAIANTGKQITAFTHRYFGMTHADRDIPPRLARKVGANHIYTNDGPASREKLQEFDLHSYGGCLENRRFVKFQRSRQLPKPSDCVIAAGTCFDAGRAYFYPYFPADLSGDTESDAAMIIQSFQMRIPFKPAPLVQAGLASWLQHIASVEDPQMDWRDRFHLDQRVGGWTGNTENATEATGHRKFVAANSHHLYAMMLSLPTEERRSGRLQREVITRLAPQLLDEPINPPLGMSEKLLERLARLARRAHLID